jgi:hypothetical protein
MATKTVITALVLSAGFVTIAIAAPPPGTSEPSVAPGAIGPLTPLPNDVRDKLRPRAVCQTDLSIERITIAATPNPAIHKVTVNIVNLGPNAAFQAPVGLVNIVLETQQSIAGRVVIAATQASREDITYILRGPGAAFGFDIPAGPPTATATQIIARINAGPDGPPSACDSNRANDSLSIPSARLRPWLARPDRPLNVAKGY